MAKNQSATIQDQSRAQDKNKGSSQKRPGHIKRAMGKIDDVEQAENDRQSKAEHCVEHAVVQPEHPLRQYQPDQLIPFHLFILPAAVRLHRFKQCLSNTQIMVEPVHACLDIRRINLVNNLAVFDDVVMVGKRRREPKILLDQDDRVASCLQVADHG